MCDAIEAHPGADFYAALAHFGRDFFAVEGQAFDLLDA
jgi:TorA maturation chaperone TorD